MRVERCSLMPEARKYLIATMMAHELRYGLYTDHQNAQSAEAHKVMFRILVTDAHELAPFIS